MKQFLLDYGPYTLAVLVVFLYFNNFMLRKRNEMLAAARKKDGPLDTLIFQKVDGNNDNLPWGQLVELVDYEGKPARAGFGGDLIGKVVLCREYYQGTDPDKHYYRRVLPLAVSDEQRAIMEGKAPDPRDYVPGTNNRWDSYLPAKTMPPKSTSEKTRQELAARQAQLQRDPLPKTS